MTHIEYSAVQAENDILRVQNKKLKEKCRRLRELAEKMYSSAKCLTTDASQLHKACEEYYRYINFEEDRK